jgi:hypothetical protein
MELAKTKSTVNTASTQGRRTMSAQKAAVIALSDFNRMKASAADEIRTSTLEEDRKRLKETCENRTKNWSNTILALRKKKEQDKYEKFEREEVLTLLMVVRKKKD